MQDKKVINYLNNFRRLFSPMLRSGVGLLFTIYPYNGGCVVVGEVGVGLQTKDEYRSVSPTLQEAMRRTNLFKGEENPGNVPGTSVILSKNYIIIIKNNDDEQWTEDVAVKDVRVVVDAVMDKRRNNG